MKRNVLALGLLTAMCLFALFESNGQNFPPIQQEFTNYITISNGEFKDGNDVFKPLCVNYIVDYACNLQNLQNIYYIAPHFNYSENYVTHKLTEIKDTVYPNGHWGYGVNGNNEMDSANIKLEHDLKIMDSLGFNVVRIAPTIRWQNNILKIPTGSYAKYFELTDELIAKCAEKNLRVIMVLSDDTNTYKQFDQYCVYLDSVTRHYSTNKTVMAYVVYMEPGYKWTTNPNFNNDKVMISNWSRKWYHIVKKNAPHQLVTYGLDGVNNVLFWDPSALTYDFLSLHFYGTSDNPIISANTVATSFKWMNDNVEDVWVLGETGFSGTTDSCNADSQVGTEIAQYHYADRTMQKSLDCGCKGYAWWQYQEVKWGNCRSEYFGIAKHYPNEVLKTIHSLFPEYSSRGPRPQCDRPPFYYKDPNYNYPNISGVVQDEYSNPIKDAFVETWSSSYKTKYSTFTDNQGKYTIYTPYDTVVNLVWISQKGYTDVHLFTNNPIPDTTTLTHINFNRWKKNWTNINYPVAGDTPEISNSDVIVKGNFCGDDAQELLIIKTSSNTAKLYKFKVNHWKQIWTGSVGDWQISSTDMFFVGDFNGDGYDELLCVQSISNSLASIFRYNSNPHYFIHPWQSIWTNSGNGQIGNWSYQPGDVILPGHFNDSSYCSLLFMRNSLRPAARCLRLASNSWETVWQPAPPPVQEERLTGYDKYYVGDFNGDSIDELLCTKVTNGTSDRMNLMQYNTSWEVLWTNNGISEGVGIYPYRANLLIGDFDSDKADEILGINTWATKFDFNASNQWDWSWSTYESGRLSDWAVNPGYRTFFLKVMTDMPDYLFVSKWIDIHIIPNYHLHLFNAYSYDP